MLLDQFGREYKAEKRPETRVMASVSIIDRYSDYPSDGLKPATLAAIFKAADQGDVYQQAMLFEEMEEKDTHLSAELLKRKNAVNSLDFDILPYDEGAQQNLYRRKSKPKSDQVVDFCKEVIFGLESFEDALFDLLDAIGKGFAICEIVWGTDGRRNIVEGLNWVHQKRLTFVDDMVPKLITQENLMGEVIPPFKAVYHRHKARSGYDTRAGMTRVCAWMYLFKNYAIKDWVAFMDVFGMPLRLGKYEPGASTADKDALIAAVRSLGSDAAGIISKSTEIEFVEAQTRSGENPFSALGDFCNREMSKAIIGATLTTDVGTSGSRALGSVHNDVRLDIVKSDCWSLANALRNQLLRPLVGYNFGWETPVPWFRFFLQEPEDQKTVSEVYLNLAKAGQPISVEHISDRFGIPLPEAGETLLSTPSTGGAGSTPPDPAIEAKRRIAAKAKSGGTGFTPSLTEQEKLEAAWAAQSGNVNDAMGVLLRPVMSLIEGAQSLNEIAEKIYGLYPQLDGARFQELLARAMFASGISGYGSAEEEQ
jgi:phage gp29-like protein